MKMEQKIKVYSAIVTGLFIMAAVSTAYFWKVSSDREAINTDLSMEKESLLVEKGLLSAQLESLHQTYNDARSENTELKGAISKNEELISEKDSQLKKLKKQSTTDRQTIEDLRKEVAAMRDLKLSLEKEVVALKSENETLRMENGQLSAELRSTQRENAELAGRISDLTMVAQNTKLPGGVRTSAFRVEVEKRNDKLTVKGKKARELVISFDMMDVPADLQGVQKVYLSVTDNKGTPVTAKSTMPVKVGLDEDVMEVLTHQTKEINITQGQRLAFNYPLDDKLKPGTYRAAIYTQIGWIGSVSFRVS